MHSRVQALKADRLAIEVDSYEETLADFVKFPSRITDKAAHSEAHEALARARYERDRDEVLLGRAFDADAKAADTFAKLARYERSIQRSFLRNLNELRQMQNKRQNHPSSSISDAVTLDANDTQ
jgi:hypothetical protein